MSEIDFKIWSKCNSLVINTKEFAVDRIKAISDVWKIHRATLLEKASKHMSQYFIRAIA